MILKKNYLKMIIKEEIEVDQKWHEHFTTNENKLENVKIRLKKRTGMFSLKGPQIYVALAKSKIMSIVNELEKNELYSGSVDYKNIDI